MAARHPPHVCNADANRVENFSFVINRREMQHISKCVPEVIRSSPKMVQLVLHCVPALCGMNEKAIVFHQIQQHAFCGSTCESSHTKIKPHTSRRLFDETVEVPL